MNPEDFDEDLFDDEELTDEEIETMSETETAAATPIPENGIEVKIQNHALRLIADAASIRIAQTLTSTVEEIVREKIDAILDGAWKASIAAQAQKAIDEYLGAPRAKTNEWGESIAGKSTTLSSLIPKSVNEWLNQRVDSNGRPSDYSRDQNTRLEWMLKTMVTDQLETETKKAAASVTEKARAIVSQHVGRFISEQMVPAIPLENRAS